MSTWPVSTGREAPPGMGLSSENYSIFCLKWGCELISIRALEIGALQEAFIDENLQCQS